MIVSEKVYQNILENLSEGIYYVDKERVITYWNRAAEIITGYSKDDVMGKSCADNILRHIDESGAELCTNSCPLLDAVKCNETKEKTIYLHHKEGHRVHVFTRVAPIIDDSGEVIGAVEMFNDLSKNSHGELICELEKLKEEAYTDPLTCIGNRRYGELNLERRLCEWNDLGIPFSVFFLDIDDFKNINDTFGHDEGDKVIRMAANSIVSTLRTMDIACRWGGEEFIVISPNLTKTSTISVADRLRAFVEKSWLNINGQDISVTVSVGCALINEDESIESLLKRADSAMYESKTTGKNKITMF